MNCLPIADRELRVAVRKRSTFWLRVAAAATGLVIGSGCLLLSLVQGAGPSRMGSVLFSILTWLCLAAALSAGPFLTADCLSEEKREGTLGLLFLTDLRGYDVALGKLMATSLRGFYALLAVLPVLAITLFMGGVSGAQYWKGSLALVNALFVSLAVGIAVSALSRDSQKALGATVFVLGLLVLGGPLADGITAAVKGRGFLPRWSLASPGYVLVAASAWGRAAYWIALGLTHVLGWALLALACALVPHTWQERKRSGASTTRSWTFAWKYGGTRRRQRLRRRLLERQPVAWLVCRERWQSLGLWLLAILIVGGFVAALIARLPQEAWIAWNYVGGLFRLLLYVWAASQACRFFIEARRSGVLELLLSAPLGDREIVSGQLRALLRMFGLPVALLLSVHVAGATLSQLGFQSLFTRVSTVTSPTVTNQTGTATSQTTVVASSTTVRFGVGTNAVPLGMAFPNRSSAQQVAMAVITAGGALLSTAGDLLALCCFGLWMGMTSKSANLATLKTLLFVQVIPWFALSFVVGLLVAMLMPVLFLRGGSPQSTAWFAWWPLLSALLAAVLAVAKDIGFIIWSRRKLHSSLREQAACVPGQARFVAPPPLSATVPAPPLIVPPR